MLDMMVAGTDITLGVRVVDQDKTMELLAGLNDKTVTAPLGIEITSFSFHDLTHEKNALALIMRHAVNGLRGDYIDSPSVNMLDYVSTNVLLYNTTLTEDVGSKAHTAAIINVLKSNIGEPITDSLINSLLALNDKDL